MDKSTRNKSFSRKSRKEIEREASENVFYQNNKKNEIDPSTYVDYNIPTFFPIFPILNFDNVVYPAQVEHIPVRLGDFPLENIESEKSIHEDLGLEGESPNVVSKEKEKISMLDSDKLNLAAQKFSPVELYWENITVVAKLKTRKYRLIPCLYEKSTKIILDECTGIARPGTFTAILGPSGCGKTTLLNFLSGRMVSNNLNITGKMKINGVDSKNIDAIGNQIAYVMQDDILLATFTPREAFNFTAALRLNLPEIERIKKVESLLSDLGLLEVANIKIGNNLIRGVSGGERKRTSIGVELLTNPSLIFLDEPTTGLDSATSFHVIAILKKLAQSGRTVMSTIHQPSSEIFGTFDKLLLMVQGKIIYQGSASSAIDYFANTLNMKAPAFSNPSTFFMKCMNAEGLLVESMQKNNNFDISLTPELKAEFKERIFNMVKIYKESENFKSIQPANHMVLNQDQNINTANWFTQFKLVVKRGLTNEFRNPMDLKARYFTTIFYSFLCCIVFTGLGDYLRGVKNREGCLFFYIMGCTFSPLMHSVLMFSSERPLFLREVLNKTYSVSAYYWGKTTSELPFQMTFPIISALIVYYIVGLSQTSPDKIVILMIIGNCTYFCSISYGILFSLILGKAEFAMAMVPMINVPFMLFAGFFSNQNSIPYYFYPVQYLSMFKYGYQAAVENEFRDTVYYYSETEHIVVDPVKEGDFGENIYQSCLILILIGLGIRILTYDLMKKYSAPKRPKLKSI